MKTLRPMLLVMLGAFHQPSAAQMLLQPAAPFTKDGLVVESTVVQGMKYERGTLNGVEYQIEYLDGSGRFGDRSDSHAGWEVSCKKDAIDDSKYCRMSKSISNLSVWTARPGGEYVFIGGNHYPGSLVTIRIDGAKPISAPAKGQFATARDAQIIAQIQKAKTVTTRYREWPNRYDTDATWEPGEFKEALQYIRWAIKQIR